MQSKKLGIVCTSPGFGGLEMFTLQLAVALQQCGWEIALLLNKKSKLYSQAATLGNVAAIQDYHQEKNKANIVKKWNEKAGCTLLFTPYNKDIQPLSFYKRFYKKNIRLIYQQHMKVGVKKRDLIHRLRYNMLDAWLTPLPYLKQETLEKTTVPERKIHLVPVGLDLSKFQNNLPSKTEARKKLDLPQEGLLLGVLGRIDPQKGQDFLVKALASLQHTAPVHLLIMGDITAHEGDTWLHHLQQLIEEKQMTARVHFRPYQKEVQTFYQAIDVFAMASHGETYGLVTLEAMYFQKPVIGVNTDGTKALLEDGKLGWLYELEDINGFHQQLQTIVNHPKATEEIVAKAHRQILTKYVFENTVREMDALFKNYLAVVPA